MNAKTNRIIYYIATGLLTVMMLMSATMYFVQNEMVTETFLRLGHPTHIIYPLAIAKILGLIAIWTKKSAWLLEWAYAGFFFDFVLAASAHTAVGDGEQFGAIIALVLLMTSYFTGKKLQ